MPPVRAAAQPQATARRCGPRGRPAKPGHHTSTGGAQAPTSAARSASIRPSGHSRQKTNHGRLGPMNLVASVPGQIGAVASVAGLH